MRVFLPSTLPALATALKAGQVGPGAQGDQPDPEGQAGLGPVPGFAVTPSLREAYASGDEEELEYTALTEAARASLRLLAADPAAAPPRGVVAAGRPVPRCGCWRPIRPRRPGGSCWRPSSRRSRRGGTPGTVSRPGS